MTAKLSEHIDLRITYEMAAWIDALVAEAGANSRSTMVRSMLQTIMDEDLAAHDDAPSLKVVEGGA